MKTALPICIMRGGTSRGFFFLQDYLSRNSEKKHHVF